ncbi:MAG TPA: hypothetical protein VGR14_02840 [Verrucomicrobiae bacterium]|jgi:hypothetical protein|nr:hypothetical protein [Verrucomicrobiae bacterium]
MKQLLDALTVVTSKFINLSKERGELDTAGKNARLELEAAAGEGPLADARIARRISAANQTLDAVSARRAYISTQLRPIVGQTKEALRTADGAWTSVIRANGNRIAAAFYAANVLFFAGNLRECQRNLNHEILPAWQENNRALWLMNACELTEDNLIQYVRSFLNKVEEHYERLDLTLGTEK